MGAPQRGRLRRDGRVGKAVRSTDDARRDAASGDAESPRDAALPIAFARRVLATYDAPAYSPLHDRGLWIFAGVVALLTYGSELFSFSLSIDEELVTLPPHWLAWMLLGRWGHAAMMYVTPPFGGIPFIGTLIFCVGLAAAAVLFSALVADGRARAFAFVAAFVSCPIWPHIAEFNTFSWGFAIGLVLCAAALLSLRVEGKGAMATAALLLAYAIAIYQTIAALFAVVAALRFVLRCASDDDSVARPRVAELMRAALAAIFGVAVYSAITKAFLVTGIAQRAQIETYLHLSDLLRGDAGTRLKILERIKAIVAGTDPAYLDWGGAVLCVAWLGLAAVVWRLAFTGTIRVRARIGAVATLAGAFALALSPIVVSSGAIPMRALVALPALYAFCAACAFTLVARRNRLSWALLAFAVATNIWISVSLFYSDSLARQRDALVAAALIPRIETVGRNNSKTAIRLSMSGTIHYENFGPFHRVEVFGESMFGHDEGNIWRVVEYLKLMGLKNVTAVSLSSVPAARTAVDSMPVWPDPRSVALVDGVVVVKFGDPSYSQ